MSLLWQASFSWNVPWALFLDLHLSLPIPPLVFHWVVHHFIDLWASSTDLGHSYLLGYVGCNHPACLRLHLSCGFVDGAVCLAGILNFALPSPACLPLHDLCPWCLWRKLLLPGDGRKFASLKACNLLTVFAVLWGRGSFVG